MKSIARFFAIVILFFSSVSALFGGTALIIDPSGKLLQMPLGFINQTIFGNYLVPGIILVTFIGISCIIVAIISMRKSAGFPLALMYQGIVLIIWILVEYLIIRQFMFLQIVYFTAGAVLVLLGLYLRPQAKQ